MTKTTIPIILIILTLLVNACDVINPKEDIPAFLTIQPFQYVPGSDGIQSTKITDGWIYVDQEFLGAFELPHTIPVLKTGEQTIFIDAGIKDNGISATPDLYPFYKRYVTTVNLVPGETVNLQPTTSYDPNIKFIWEEYFEGSSHKLTADLDEIEETKVVFETSIVKEGNKSGRIHLDQENSIILVGSREILEPAVNGAIAFLEMDYKTDVAVLMGFLGYDEFGQVNFTQVDFGVNPSADWNKIYFNVSEIISGLAIAQSKTYQIVFQAQLPTENGGFTMENAEIYLDNLKLISF